MAMAKTLSALTGRMKGSRTKQKGRVVSQAINDIWNIDILLIILEVVSESLGDQIES